MNFYNWAMNNEYQDNLTLDRIDVNNNYCPKNCRWITMKEQQNNRRNNHFIEYNGETHTISEWAKIYNINRGTLQSRIKRNFPLEKIFSSEDYRLKKQIT